MLEKILAIAVDAHAEKMDLQGLPFILHPMRVAEIVRGKGFGLAHQAVAIGHDLVEDTDWTLERLEGEGFPEFMVQAWDCLTHRPHEPYRDYILRIEATDDRSTWKMGHPPSSTAIVAKVADLEDNMRLDRIIYTPKTELSDARRMLKYARAYSFLTGKIDAEEFSSLKHVSVVFAKAGHPPGSKSGIEA